MTELSEIWSSSKDRSSISKATNEFDRLLRDRQNLFVMELSEGLFSLKIAPLKFAIAFNHKDRIVEVLKVQLI